MDLREARAFVTVCDTLNFRQAATRLHVSASTVSETIRRLESRLETRLFERTTHSVALTRAAQRLLPSAVNLLAAEAELNQAASAEHDGAVPLQIGVMYGLGADEIRAAAVRLGIEVEIRTFELRESACGLDEVGAVDAAVIAGPVEGDDQLTRATLWTERRVVPVPPGHPLASLDVVRIADVDEVGWVDVEMNDSVWKRHWRLDDLRGGPPIEIGPPESSALGLADAVVSGRALIITIESYERVFSWATLESLPVVDAPAVEIDLAWRTDEGVGRKQELAEAIRSIRAERS